ncbi:MAG: ABC transporter ATP-binding protein [Actinomycetota bacterium]|nr:ABC transporter ATP-binding protein [Actinomycetota bacterium]
MKPLLHLRGVEARYGHFVALQNVSLIVPEGAVVALLGPNGAGKTTLLRTVSGMMSLSRGEIIFDGAPIQRLPDYAIARRGLAHIPEGRGIFPSLTVRENLLMAGYGAPNGDGALGRVYELFPVLAQRREQAAGTLSGGEQQMLSLARGVITRPKLLAVDELSLGLAPILVAQLFDTVARIRDSGTSILLVEQYVRHALRLADIVVILHKGRVAFIGEPGELAHDDSLVESYLGGKSSARFGVASEDAVALPMKATASSQRSKKRRVSRG